MFYDIMFGLQNMMSVDPEWLGYTTLTSFNKHPTV